MRGIIGKTQGVKRAKNPAINPNMNISIYLIELEKSLVTNSVLVKSNFRLLYFLISSSVTLSSIFNFLEGSIGMVNVSFLKTHNSSSHDEYIISTLNDSKSRFLRFIILLKLVKWI